MSIENLLRDQIQYELEGLEEIPTGSDGHKEGIDNVAKLSDRVIEFERLELEREDKAETRKDERRNRIITHCIAAAGIVIPVLVTIWGTKKSFEFEKEGTITTIMGRGFINKLLPKK